MKSGWLAVGTLLLGILLGVLIAPAIRHARASTASNDEGKLHEAKPAGTGEGEIARHASPASRKPIEPRVSVPLGQVSKFLKKDLHYGIDTYRGRPSSYGKSIDEALVLLDASDREKEEIHSIFATLDQKLWEAEKASIKVTKSGPEGVELSLTGFTEATKPILEQARQDILKALPGPEGEVFVSSFPWSKADFGSGDDEKENPDPSIRLRIVRGKDGLLAQIRSGGVSNGMFLATDGYKDDGTPIPAEKAFEPIWKPWLSGVSFLPVDESP